MLIRAFFHWWFPLCLSAAFFCFPRWPLPLHGNGIHAWGRLGESDEQLWRSREVGPFLYSRSSAGSGWDPRHGLHTQVKPNFSSPWTTVYQTVEMTPLKLASLICLIMFWLWCLCVLPGEAVTPWLPHQYSVLCESFSGWAAPKCAVCRVTPHFACHYTSTHLCAENRRLFLVFIFLCYPLNFWPLIIPKSSL